MSVPVSIDVPHQLGRDGARARLKARVGDLASHIPGGMADVRSSWPGENEMALEIAAMGQAVSARLEVLDSMVRVHLVLPPMLAFFSGMIGAAVKEGGTRMLEDQKQRVSAGPAAHFPAPCLKANGDKSMRNALSFLALGALMSSAAPAAGPFTLTSTSFADGAIIPLKYTGKIAGNANCPGDNVSPQLAWSNLPEGTQSIALLMIDPEGRAPIGVNHWIAYGIPTTRTSFAEGEVTQTPVGYMGGKSTQGLDHYMGPCTGPNTTWHHYTWVAIATDLAPDALPAGLTREEFTAKVTGHVKGSSGFVGRFKHQ